MRAGEREVPEAPGREDGRPGAQRARGGSRSAAPIPSGPTRRSREPSPGPRLGRAAGAAGPPGLTLRRELPDTVDELLQGRGHVPPGSEERAARAGRSLALGWAPGAAGRPGSGHVTSAAQAPRDLGLGTSDCFRGNRPAARGAGSEFFSFPHGARRGTPSCLRGGGRGKAPARDPRRRHRAGRRSGRSPRAFPCGERAPPRCAPPPPAAP